jgi:hypothetical protein
MSAPICHHYFDFWGCKLLCPLQMTRLTLAQILARTNGCGREGIEGRLVPDSIWGLDISPVCNVHDVMYQVADTREEEDYADAIFGANLISIIQQKTSFPPLKWLRLRRAYKYVDAVAMTNVLDVATLESIGMGDMTC